eukprot:12172934-Alexandrium_andersonii.AAC.1
MRRPNNTRRTRISECLMPLSGIRKALMLKTCREEAPRRRPIAVVACQAGGDRAGERAGCSLACGLEPKWP